MGGVKVDVVCFIFFYFFWGFSFVVGEEDSRLCFCFFTLWKKQGGNMYGTSAKVQIDYRLRYAHTRTRAAHSKLPVDPCATRSL